MKKTWFAVIAAVAVVLAGCSSEPDEEPSPWKIENGVLIRYEGADEQVTIPAEVKEIGARAFKGRTALKGVTIPESVTKVGDNAFDGCTSLAGVVIPDGVTEIGHEAFSGCAALASASIPNSVTDIGENPFKDCDALAEVTCAKNISGWSKLIVRRGSKEGFTTVRCADGEWHASDMDDWQSAKLNGKYTLVRYLGSGADVTVPAWISVIGEEAFKDKDKIKTVKILKNATGDSQYISANAFEGCASLVSVEMPDGMGRIDTDAFKGCADVDISFAGTKAAWSQVAKNANIADCVMVRCNDGYWYNLRYWEINENNWLDKYTGTAKTVRLPEYVELIDNSAFNSCENLECVQIPVDLGDFGFCKLNDCETLTRVEILDGVTSIGKRAFQNCDRLVSVTISDSVEGIGDGAFYGCRGLRDVTIGDGVKSIGEEAFSFCDSLASLTIPDGVKAIGKNAFGACGSLDTITYQGTLAQWCALSDSSSFMSYAKHVNIDGDDLKGMSKVVIPDGVKAIGSGAFCECASLVSVTIPYSVESIGKQAFYQCRDLTIVTIPDSVESIGEQAFWQCMSLTTVTIGSSVGSIGKEAFYNCAMLKDVTYHGTKAQWEKIIGSNSSDISKATIHCTDGDITPN